MSAPVKRVVVVGGGISGLSAAYYLHKQARETGVPVHVTLVEKSGRLGGRVCTLRRDGFVIEQGPDSFIGRKAAAVRLASELGLESELLGTNPGAKQNFIIHKGKLLPMPKGLALGIPTQVLPFVTTKLISWPGKLRAGMDLLLPRKGSDGDEALGAFIERRLGTEVLDRIVEPLLAGIYAGDTRSLSIRSTFPQFQHMEKKYRSLILGMIAGKTEGKKAVQPQAGSSITAAQPKGNSGVPAAARKSMFLSFRSGLSALVERLEKALSDAGTDMVKGCGVQSIERNGAGYRVVLENGQEMEAEGVIITLPADRSGKLLQDDKAAAWLDTIPYVTVANVVLAYRNAEIGNDLTGSGFVVPRTEGRFITACTWTSSKWPHTAPEGKALLRCYVGRAGDEADPGLSDADYVSRVRRDLFELMGIAAEPEFAVVTRLPRSMPQYTVDHGERVSELRQYMQHRYPGVLLCGSGYNGVGIPDCISQGETAANQMAAYLGI